MTYLNKNLKVPAKDSVRYLHLKDQIISDMKGRKLKNGDKFDSQRELMKKYSLSYSTVSSALKELTDEGYIYRKHGSGTYVGHRLEKGKTCTVGVVHFMSSTEDFLTMALPSQILQGIHDELQSYNWNIMISSYNYSEPRIPAMIEDDLIDGLIFTLGIDKRLKSIVDRIDGIPFILAGNYVAGENWPSVVADNITGIRKSMEHLFALGHKNIAYMYRPCEHAGMEERFVEYKKIMIEKGLFKPELVFGAEYSHEAFAKYLSIKDKVTAICIAGDDWAAKFMKYGTEKDIKVPETVSIIGYDDIPVALEMNPPLTTVRTDRNLLGRKTVQKLKDMIENKKAHQGLSRIPSELIVRGTTAPAR